ncbi:unnamed protein product [Leptidea sinapis]|uniref:Tektin n=1 Tax=Leptidea sinapis TaxID=189913 RepID=A0A5E4QM73_9NEOP|nr:unnamed protein product [Leptidea sinapis]
MDASIPVFEKPHPRPSVLDWTRNIQKLQNEARIRRFESYETRQRGNQLRNETAVTTRWDTYVNNELLRDRIFEVEAWREKQRFVREQVRDESRALREEKHKTELHLESLQELHIIENSKRVLTDVCNMGWEKLKELTNVFCRLEREIQNKDDTLAIESYVKDLSRESSDITYKLDPTRIPPNTMSEENYVNCIETTIKIAEQLMKESKVLRETMFKSCEQAANQMYAQSQQVEMIMRRRVFDVQRARNEMEWQKYKLEEHLRKLDREIGCLRSAVADKINPTKLVETRLEARTQRPVLERVQDLEYKNQALETDRRLIEIRAPLHRDHDTQLDRNVGYCRMGNELVTD